MELKLEEATQAGLETEFKSHLYGLEIKVNECKLVWAVV